MARLDRDRLHRDQPGPFRGGIAHREGDAIGRPEGDQSRSRATMRANPKVAAPRARWIVTIPQSNELVIVNAPNPTCATRMPKPEPVRVTRRRSVRYQRRAKAIVSRRQRLVNAATRRGAYSTATRGFTRFGTMGPLRI